MSLVVFLLLFLEKFEEWDIRSSLKVWKNSAMNPSGPELFFFWETIVSSVMLPAIDLFRWIIFTCFNFASYMYLEIFPFVKIFQFI
jgi:hypothetical protein